MVVLPGTAISRERLNALLRQRLDPRRVLRVSPGDAAFAMIEGGGALSAAGMVATRLEVAGMADGLRGVQRLQRIAPRAVIGDSDSAARWKLDLALRERAPLQLDPPEALTSLALVPRVPRPGGKGVERTHHACVGGNRIRIDDTQGMVDQIPPGIDGSRLARQPHGQQR